MASTPPLIFKRTKSKPAARSRQRTPEEENEKDKSDVGAEREESPSTLATKLKNKVKKAKPKSRLSFGGDEEEGDGEVFQVKKSNLSRKLALGTHPASIPLNLEQATISPNRGPSYDQAYLNQLKASTPTGRPPQPTADPYDADMSMDVSMDMGDTSVANLTTGTEDDSASFIPSESSIQVAKEKRERLRKTQASGEDDYISLSVTKASDVAQGPHPGSRLVREEDELGEGDDEFAEYTSAQERIALGKKSRKVEASKRRDAMKEMIADAEEEDDETIEWEQEQLRRGGHRTPEPSSSASKIKQVYKPAPIPQQTPVPMLAPALARLTQQLTQLTTSHANTTAALSSLSLERGELDQREKEMREMVGKAEEKRAWFGSFKEWVEGVAGFLDAKYPLLEKLEEEHISLIHERCDLVKQRRQAEDEDDLLTFLGTLPPQPTDSQVEEVDELGRTVPKPNPTAERRERRAARVVRRQQRQQQQRKAEDEEGYSTDSSLPPPDASAYSTAIESMTTRKKEVLADVRAEEFRDPGKGRWSAWREKYADSYVGAWGGLGVVSVWEFWVRLEIVGWDCVEDSRELHSFKWYKGLFEYSRPGDADIDAGERELGPDGDLVASMVSTAVIPRITKLVEEGAFDAYSAKHIRRVINLLEEVETYVEAGNPKFQTLLKTTVTTFQAAVTDTEALIDKFNAVKHNAFAFNPEAIPARRRFLARRVKLLKNLLRWKKYTGERYGIGQLISRLVEVCIFSIAEGGWDVGGEEVAQNVASMLPNELVPFQLKRRLQLR